MPKVWPSLVRAGKKLSTETVRRYRKNPVLLPAPATKSISKRDELGVLRAKEANHIWMTDITDVPSFLRIWIFKLVVILDVYSRFPLTFKVFSKEPTSEEIALLVENAVHRYGAPKHFVTDRGPQFTGLSFVEKLRTLGISQRFGAIGRTGSIAIIERLWRTLKEMLDLRFRRPLSAGHLEDTVALGLFYYATLRPHQGLNGDTPAEIYFGLIPASVHAVSPPRANRETQTNRSSCHSTWSTPAGIAGFRSSFQPSSPLNLNLNKRGSFLVEHGSRRPKCARESLVDHRTRANASSKRKSPPIWPASGAQILRKTPHAIPIVVLQAFAPTPKAASIGERIETFLHFLWPSFVIERHSQAVAVCSYRNQATRQIQMPIFRIEELTTLNFMVVPFL
ncbi:MAG TPA: DDE-type integrase/transposase/recombinase [Thermoanaerobaculia bacterium]|nr:DDE-type integrase/transposase/recombinase [Thermoanaerobaculia bacterium]